MFSVLLQWGSLHFLATWLIGIHLLHPLCSANQSNPNVHPNTTEAGNVLRPRVHITELGCSQRQQEIIIQGLRAVSQWSQWAIDTAVGRRIDDLDYQRQEAFQHYFHGDSQAIRKAVQHRFASLQYEADRSPEGRFQDALARVMMRCDNSMLFCQDRELTTPYPRLNMVILVYIRALVLKFFTCFLT